MRYAKWNHKTLDAHSYKFNKQSIINMSAKSKIVCLQCNEPVIFCAGPIKAPYFAHKSKNKDCDLYHYSSYTPTTRKTTIIDEITHYLSSLLNRNLIRKEKLLIEFWLYHENYQTSEIIGAASEVLEQNDEPNIHFFKRADSRLFAITRRKNNPYFQPLTRNKA